MSASKRADVLARTQKILAKHYKPVKPVERSVLEQLLYAACLEDSRDEAADESFARLQESFFDWNEVRVTTVPELSEMMRGTHDPKSTATTVKQILHSVFEALYEFDLEVLKKQNLGAAVKQLQQMKGPTPFAISYVVQSCLGGHSIPLSKNALDIMEVLGAITPKERAAAVVPGLERAIPKTKGAEFGSLLHQLAADYAASPFGTRVRAILLEIVPSAKDRLPKRSVRKTAPPPAKKSVKAKTSDTSDRKKKRPAQKQVTGKKAAKKKSPVKKKAASKAKAKAKKKSKSASITKKATRGAKKSASKQLARRKPR